MFEASPYTKRHIERLSAPQSVPKVGFSQNSRLCRAVTRVLLGVRRQPRYLRTSTPRAWSIALVKSRVAPLYTCFFGWWSESIFRKSSFGDAGRPNMAWDVGEPWKSWNMVKIHFSTRFPESWSSVSREYHEIIEFGDFHQNHIFWLLNLVCWIMPIPQDTVEWRIHVLVFMN